MLSVVELSSNGLTLCRCQIIIRQTSLLLLSSPFEQTYVYIFVTCTQWCRTILKAHAYFFTTTTEHKAPICQLTTTTAFCVTKKSQKIYVGLLQ